MAQQHERGTVETSSPRAARRALVAVQAEEEPTNRFVRAVLRLHELLTAEWHGPNGW